MEPVTVYWNYIYIYIYKTTVIAFRFSDFLSQTNMLLFTDVERANFPRNMFTSARFFKSVASLNGKEKHNSVYWWNFGFIYLTWWDEVIAKIIACFRTVFFNSDRDSWYGYIVCILSSYRLFLAWNESDNADVMCLAQQRNQYEFVRAPSNYKQSFNDF